MPGSPNHAYDTIVIGGGLVGAALASGIASHGGSLAVVDGGDRDLRASRGNFGLVWVQGKGADYAPYARWSGLAARRWARFAAELEESSGVDLALRQNGGYDFCLDEAEWNERREQMQQVAEHTEGAFEYEMLDGDELRRRLPSVGAGVFGASFSGQDGHVNPLMLLHALHRNLRDRGADYFPDATVGEIIARGGGFEIDTAAGRFSCARVAVCAGLGSTRLAAQLEIDLPLYPLRGQLLISERVKRFLSCATSLVRQTAEGTVQIGDSHEQAGYDDSATLDTIERIATRAVRIFPHLADARLQRAWGALRVMTSDGWPVYQQSPEYSGAFAVTCHSGVTLASLHAGEIADWICGLPPHELIADFGSGRFDVQAA